jgi:hypothetical protein
LCASVVWFVAIACKPVQNVSEGESAVQSATKPASFMLKPGVKSVFKKETAQSSTLGVAALCELVPNVTYRLASDPVPAPVGHFAVTITNSDYNCPFKNGYIFAEHVNVSYSSSSGSGSAYCQYSWEEKLGTTDYTTFDVYRGSSFSNPDRPQSQTLLGNTDYAKKLMCQKAQLIKHCFRKAVLESNEVAAQRFRNWAAAKGVDPVLALMAKTQKETKLGTVKDSCFYGSCNGVGIGQIITAVDENGNSFGTSDARWVGITHNILTNLKYSVRVISLKTGAAENLWKLAYLYNGHPVWKWSYASAVEQNYKDLKACGL